MMAGGAFFDITVTGIGSHGARPEECIDPVLTVCHIMTALQAIVSRNISPRDTAVLSVTTIQAGGAYNVIPQTTVMRGTYRSFSNDTMKQIEDGMRRISAGIAAALGATAAPEAVAVWMAALADGNGGRDPLGRSSINQALSAVIHAHRDAGHAFDRNRARVERHQQHEGAG
jgi:amidohydrolase